MSVEDIIESTRNFFSDVRTYIQKSLPKGKAFFIVYILYFLTVCVMLLGR